MSQFVKPPTGKSFRFVRASGRGEAVWASERRFDAVARAVRRAVYLLLLLCKNHAGWVVHEKCGFHTGFTRFFADKLRISIIKTTLFVDNLVKPV